MLIFLCFIVVVLVVYVAYKSIFFVFGASSKPKISFDENDFVEYTNTVIYENPKQDIQKIRVVGGTINSSRITEYKGEEIKSFEFRPQTWEQFIGQTEAKNKAKTIMKKAKRGIRSHFLVDGIKGHGKTTFVELLAKSLNAKLIERVGKQIDEDSLVEIINEINVSQEKYVVFFVDEMETTDWKVIKILNPVIEQFKINNIKIKPFLFAGATINKHILIENNPDTLDRIPPSHHLKFARYTAEEIEKIIRQYKQQLYPDEQILNEILKIISKNSKFNPPTSIALLEDFIVEQDIQKVLKNSKIIKDGLNELDIRILRILSKVTRPMGANALAMKCKLSQKEYITEFEPFLVEYDYVNRVPSRIITEKGKNILEELENEI